MKKRLILSVSLALLFVAGVLIYIFVIQKDFRFDDAATDGNLSGMSEREIAELMKNKVDESMLEISIASTPQFNDGKSKGMLGIENSASNRYNIIVEIKRDDTGEVIYKSEGIKPGQMIKEDKLDVELKKGVYKCTATFTAYDTDSNDRTGSAAAKIQIQVKN